jgi:hypothetical protein
MGAITPVLISGSTAGASLINTNKNHHFQAASSSFLHQKMIPKKNRNATNAAAVCTENLIRIDEPEESPNVCGPCPSSI